ncbi:hypothetical protein [Streptomyces sp. 6N223]|uniref:hypothetical protein n=1 Tax=Streptomyces sp. 6N223 TaxID=3457412 RepID=UPI003FD2D33A
MPAEADEAPEAGRAFALASHWQELARGWAAGGRAGGTVRDAAPQALAIDIPGSDIAVTVRLTATTRLLVAFMTNGRLLAPDQLATAAAAASAWNTKHLVPMLSLWDVGGRQPCIAGICSLPLVCRVTPGEFGALADEWVAGAHRMFGWCRGEFAL